ncbi:hypothetical protein EV714DRAFT_273529 [Schizophyllum commune]
MSPLPKIVVPLRSPRTALPGAGAAIPQLQTSFRDVEGPAALGGVLSSVECAAPPLAPGASPNSASQDLQRALHETTGLRAALDRANRSLHGLRSRLSSRDREVQRLKADKDVLAQQVSQQGAVIATLSNEVTALGSQIDDLRVQLSFLEARRATAARRFSVFEARSRRLQYENEGLRAELAGRVQELRFARDAAHEAEEDARSAQDALARLRRDSSLAIQRLRTRLRELTAAHRSRVPGVIYRRLLARANAYVSRFGPFEGLPSEDAAELADEESDEDGAAARGVDDVVAEGGDADMDDVSV